MSEQAQLDLDVVLDDMDESIEDMTEEDFERIVKGNSREAFEIRRARKAVRYRLARIKTEVLGGPASEDHDGLKERFEAMPLFGGWRWYGVNWDVDLIDPFKIVSRTHSKIEEWEAIIAAKFPVIQPGGKIQYPDIKVKEAVAAEAKRRKE